MTLLVNDKGTIGIIGENLFDNQRRNCFVAIPPELLKVITGKNKIDEVVNLDEMFIKNNPGEKLLGEKQKKYGL